MRITMALALVGTACSGDGKRVIPITDTGTSTTTDFVLPPELYVDDTNIYAYDPEWSFASIRVRSEFELNIRWPDLTTDGWDEPHAADGYGKLLLYELSEGKSEVEIQLAIDDLQPAILNTWELDVAGHTEAQLSELTQGGTAFDPFTALTQASTSTWLMVLADQTDGRLDLRSGLIIEPDDGQTGTLVTLPVGGGRYSWEAKIDGQDEIDTSPGHPVYTLDWSGVTTDAYGKPFDPTLGDTVFVAQFDTVDEGDDLSGEVLDLEAKAIGWWTVDPGGATSVTLEQAVDSGGAPFPGFEEDVVWLVGQSCTACMGPAPLWITSIRPR